MREANINELLGKTLKNVVVDNEKNEITFTTDYDNVYKLFHDQNCCEEVFIADIAGDISDLLGAPLLLVSEETNRLDSPLRPSAEEYTWTFYKFATRKGYVDIRFFGESNGYYSESVNCVQLS